MGIVRYVSDVPDTLFLNEIYQIYPSSMPKAPIVRILLIFLGLFSLGKAKLLVVHSIFRHGERTTDTTFMYPNDPYRNETFFPYGHGQLTNEGKRTMYNFGKMLKNRYENLLGNLYMPGLVDPWASSLPRTQAALQLVLAALFPPIDSLVWEDSLNWQPIPFHFLPRQDDDLLLAMLSKKYVQIYNQYCGSEEAREEMERAAPLLSYIRQHSGSPANTPRDFFFLYITFITEDHYGLALPQWTKAIYPQPIKDMIHLEFEMEMGTKQLRKELIGRIMKKILIDTENHINGKSSYKMHLYSAHDVNVVYVLKFLNLMYKHAPGYSSCISLEMHEEDGEYFLEVQYKDDKHSAFKLLQFENGESRMHLEDFREMVNELVDEKTQKEELQMNLPQNNAPIKFKKDIFCLEIIIILICCKYFC